MDAATIWYLAIGFILIVMGVSTSVVERLPVTASIFYLAIGVMLGHYGLQVVDLHLVKDARLFERITEIVVIVALFCAGLKLRCSFWNRRWIPPFRLAFLSMFYTVVMVAVFGHYFMDLPWGAGILLGAILSPTDPVLASDVQVRSAADQDLLRFSLTGEAGLNDGTAFPFVMLGLGLLGFHEIGEIGLRWFFIDGLWAIVAGLGLGWYLGLGVSKFVLYLRRRNQETIILDDFLAMGLVALAYGLALGIHAYGFLAVFAAGLAMRSIDKAKESESIQRAEPPKQVLAFTEQMERIGEVFTVIFLGTMINLNYFRISDLWLVPVLMLIIRPTAVLLGLVGAPLDGYQKSMISWFGIRGIGSIYYLTYAFGKGVNGEFAERLASLTLATVVISICIHGISALPFMKIYERKEESRP